MGRRSLEETALLDCCEVTPAPVPLEQSVGATATESEPLSHVNYRSLWGGGGIHQDTTYIYLQ